MTAPFAEYELTSLPTAPMTCSLALGQRLVLDPRVQTFVSRRQEDAIFVQPQTHALFDLGWGGTRNHCVDFHEGEWRVQDLGHGKPGRVNGQVLRSHELRNGDRIEPATGLVFTFRLCTDYESLADALAAEQVDLTATEVLTDWLLERLGGGVAETRRVILHFRYRVGHVGAL